MDLLGNLEIIQDLSHEPGKVQLVQCGSNRAVLLRNVLNLAIYERLHALELPDLPKILEIGLYEGKPAVLEEYIEGDLLYDVLAKSLFSAAKAEQLIDRLCRTLETLHSAGIVHRDIKPENILLRGEEPVLIDFDAARLCEFQPAQHGRKDTRVLGTVGYAAPEQFGFSQTDYRADIYSVGVLLNVLRTGEHPSVKLADGRAGEIVLRCTQVTPDRRFQSAEELAKALKSGRMAGNPARWLLRIVPVALLAVLLVLAAYKLKWNAVDETAADNTPVSTVSGALVEPEPMLDGELSAPEASAESAAEELPMVSPTSSVEYTLDEETWQFVAAWNGELSAVPRDQNGIQTVDVSIYRDQRLMIPAQLCVIKDGMPIDDESKQQVLTHIMSCRVEILPISGASAVTAPLPMFDIGTDGVLFTTNVSYAPDCADCLLHWYMQMDSGEELQLTQQINVRTLKTVSYDYHGTRLDTVADIEALLEAVNAAEAPETTLELHLAPGVYDQPLTIRDRRVLLMGAEGEADRTVFTDTIRLEGGGSVSAILGITFAGAGAGIGVESHVPLCLQGCSFSGWDTGVYAYSSVTMTDNYFSDNHTGILVDAEQWPTYDSLMEQNQFLRNDTAVHLYRVEMNRDMTISFAGCRFLDNGIDINNSCGIPVDSRWISTE